MAKQSIAQLKQWFQTGDYPTQQQFYDWMESYRHLDDEVPMASVTGLVQILQTLTNNQGGGAGTPPVIVSGTNTWAVPAGTLIEKLVVIDTAALTLSAGTTAGSSNLLEAAQCSPAFTIIATDIYFQNAGSIFFTGMNAETIIKIYRR